MPSLKTICELAWAPILLMAVMVILAIETPGETQERSTEEME